MYTTKTSFLVSLEGTEVTTDVKPDLQLPAQTWVITEKLGEMSLLMCQKDIDDGAGPTYAAAKFLCYRKDDLAKKPAFMRIYRQVPIIETDWLPFGSPASRANQAAPLIEFAELKAFKALTNMACSVVPRLLGYQEGTQAGDGIIPGGFTLSLVWDKVPGEPLTEKYFWGLDFDKREAIRQEFRRVYEQLVPCGIKPRLADLSKLIYDESTGTMHISGFRTAGRVDPQKEWSDTNYVLYGLVRAPVQTDRQGHEDGWRGWDGWRY